MRIEAPSTGHSIAGRSGSPVGSISMAPKPPVSASSITCSTSVRKLSAGFGSSSARRRARSFRAAKATSSGRTPRRTRTCQSMAAMRSLITLMARRTTGVSANLRRFMGVGLGRCRPGNCTGLRIAGSASVLRSASASSSTCRPCTPGLPACRGGRLPPHLPQLLANLHAHLPCLNKKARPWAMPFFALHCQCSVVSQMSPRPKSAACPTNEPRTT